MGSSSSIMRATIFLAVVAVASGAPKFSKKALSTPWPGVVARLLVELKPPQENTLTRLLCSVEELEDP